MSTSADDTADLARLLHAAGGHAHALAEISAHTAAGLVVISGALEISHFRAVQRSVRRERRRADRFRALERDLERVEPTGRTALAPAAFGVPPRPDVSASGRPGWLHLIELRQWNIRHSAESRRALRALAGELVPLLRGHGGEHAKVVAACLEDCLVATTVSPSR